MSIRRQLDMCGFDDDTLWVKPGGEVVEEPTAESLSRGSNFKLLCYSKDKKWVLFRHAPTREEKWVYLTYLLMKEDIALAFYDADPTFLPEGERP
jgi:hypothetical protein